MSPTQRTLKLLRDEGMVVGVVEYFNFYTKRRHDLFQFIDLVALDIINKKTWGIQTTTTSNMSARINKINTECKDNATAWLNAGNHIMVIGWAKQGPKGKRKLWIPKKVVIDSII